MLKAKKLHVGLKLGFLEVSGEWEPDENEQRAAWELYVELMTRVAVTELQPDEGLLSEALSSLYSLFDTTRKILRQYGPEVAQPKGEGTLSFGYIAVAVLNGVLRPLLEKYHPLLLDYQNDRPSGLSVVDHEANWNRAQELRAQLNKIRLTLIEYADLLADVADVPSLHLGAEAAERGLPQ